MIRVSHWGKMGDLVYALPVLRALSRLRGEKIQLMTSGACWQLAPLLWEQPYIGDVELDDSQAHYIEHNVFPNWEFFKPCEGLNLSLQPMYFEPSAPVSWTHCYMKAAGVTELLASDCVALPSLVNHRRWLQGVDVALDGKPQKAPKTVIIATETDTLDELFPEIWQEIMDQITEYGYEPVLVGTRRTATFVRCTDLRGLTSVPVLARVIADSRAFIGAHSFPWHLARHSETPAICLQTWREGLRRCLPVDTPYTWVEPKHWRNVIPTLLGKSLLQEVVA